MILELHESRCTLRESRSMQRDSRSAGNETQLVTYL